ncbi:MAG TPA: cell division protein ZapA [Sphingomonas sp.]|nr:cell division protein ZapA [Sphingomonas sp.]
MGQVKLSVAGRAYDLACRDGEEPRLQMLATMLDAKARDAGELVGSTNESRQLLLAGLLLADELSDLRAGAPDPGKAALARTLDQLAEWIETIAERLEQTPQTP